MTFTEPQSIRTIFMGTPEIALPILEGLLEDRYNIVSVYTKPDRRAGRGRHITPSPVKKAAINRGIPVYQPASLKNDESARAELKELEPQLVVVAAYGLFLPPDILECPQFGCLNLHPSILPRHRGPSPVATAILMGDQKTGVSIIKLDEGMDSGPILGQRETDIGKDEGTEELTARLFQMGATLFTDVLPNWINGTITAKPQSDSLATITRLLERSTGEIDWSESATQLERTVRAFRPWPGTFTEWNGKVLKIIEATSRDTSCADTTPGTVMETSDSQTAVITGNGLLVLNRLQLEGRRAMTAAEFAQGYQGFIGSSLNR